MCLPGRQVPFCRLVTKSLKESIAPFVVRLQPLESPDGLILTATLPLSQCFNYRSGFLSLKLTFAAGEVT
jgi:hypothetical protein